MRDDNRNRATSGVFDSAAGDVNRYAPVNAGSVSTARDVAQAVGKFAAAGWEKVGEGLVLVYLGTVLAIVSVFATFLLALAGPAMAGIGAFGVLLGGLAAIVGQWMCRSVPTDTGLRNSITIACLGFSYQWMSGALTLLNPWLHFARDTLVAIRLTNGAAQLVAMGCFLWFLAGMARHSGDESLLTKAKWLLSSFLAFTCVWLLLRLITVGSTGHLAHHAHVAHHLRPLGASLAVAIGVSLIGTMIAWLTSYVSLLKSLADKIDAGR